MPKPFPREFRDDVVNVARGREVGQTIKQIAAGFGIAASRLVVAAALRNRSNHT